LVEATAHSITHPYGIKQFVSRIKDHQYVQAYDPQHAFDDSDPQNLTRQTPGKDAKIVFAYQQQPQPQFHGLNLLDIVNTECRRFCPTAIDDVDLVKRIVDKTTIKRANLSRPTEEEKRETYKAEALLHEEWMILTNWSSASPFHCDAAGQLTCVVGLEGRKVWCVPRGTPDGVLDEFEPGGPRFT